MNCFFFIVMVTIIVIKQQCNKKNSNDFATGSSFGRSCSYLIRLPLRGLLLRHISPFPYHVSSITFTIQFDVDSLPTPNSPPNPPTSNSPVEFSIPTTTTTTTTTTKPK